MEPSTYTLQGWHRFQRGALAAGAGALALCLAGALFSPPQFYRSYLFAYVFWIGVALGCLGIMMLHNLTGGAWGIIIRRLVESGTISRPARAHVQNSAVAVCVAVLRIWITALLSFDIAMMAHGHTPRQGN
jgi:hypothetical protein